MPRFMLDTSICIYVLKNYPVGFRSKFEALAGSLCMSCITLCELHYGAEKSDDREATLAELGLFAAKLEVLPFPAKAAEAYGRLRQAIAQSRRSVGPLDLLIGAHALSEGLTLVTNNRREFDRMPGLNVENWV
jgi:tRNA(fMet)-specific endonuclease VapC